ncbi:hypothetical protein [Clostridium coskatii]|nr:hypothetical protein [Clostridium coskatii]
MYRCAECTIHVCKHDMMKTMEDCPSKNEEIQRKAKEAIQG